MRPTRPARSAASRAGSVSTPSTSQPRAANAVASGSPIAPHPTTTICGVSVTGKRAGDGSNTGSKRDFMAGSGPDFEMPTGETLSRFRTQRLRIDVIVVNRDPHSGLERAKGIEPSS